MAASGEVLLSRAPSNEEFGQAQAYYAASEENMTFCGWVHKTKKKKTKAEVRLLTIGQYRVATWKEAKLGSALKLAREGHLLDLGALDYLETADHAAVNLKFKDFSFPFVETLSRGRHIVSLVKNFYALFRIGVDPADFFGLYVNADTAPSDLGTFVLPANVPFAGFVEAYEAYCAYGGIALASAVDYRGLLDTIVQHAGDHSISLAPSMVASFDYLDSKTKPLFDLEPFVRALAHNTYFTSLTVSSITRLDVIDALATAFETNTAITELNLADASANAGFAAFGRALTRNTACSLTAINLSGNCVKDKGLAALAPGLAGLALTSLNLSFCQFGAKGMSALSKALSKSPTVSATLAELDLAGNKLGAAGTDALASLCVDAGLSALAMLNVADTSLKVKKMAPLLAPAVSPLLVDLNLSGNTFVDRDVVFLSNALMHSAVTQLDLSEAKVSIDSLAGIVGCLVTDRTRTRSVLDLSSIPLKPAGAVRLASSISVALNIHTLILDDTQLGAEGMVAIIEALKLSRMVEELSLSRNVRAKDKAAPDVVARLVDLLGLDGMNITSLEILGNAKYNLGPAIVPLFNALATNTTVKELNVEGNAFRDDGANALAAALNTNTTLETIFVDNNGMSLEGLGAFAAGVAANTSIVNLPIPDVEFKRIVIDNAGDAAAFDTMRNIIKTLRFAVRFNKSGRNVGWTAPPSLFGDSPDESDHEWLARDKVERRARRAARRAAKANTDDKRRTLGPRSALNARAKKRETVSISDFKVEDFMEHIGSVNRASALSSGGGSGSLLAAAARNRASPSSASSSSPLRPSPPPRPPKPRSLSAVTDTDDYSSSSDDDDDDVPTRPPRSSTVVHTPQ